MVFKVKALGAHECWMMALSELEYWFERAALMAEKDKSRG